MTVIRIPKTEGAKLHFFKASILEIEVFGAGNIKTQTGINSPENDFPT